jgi:hypothetical protein
MRLPEQKDVKIQDAREIAGTKKIMMPTRHSRPPRTKIQRL